MDVLIGVVSHYYDKIGVAIVEVNDQSIQTGDVIKFSGHGQEFEQKVKSMQFEHEAITKASKGMSVGIKVDKKVKPRDQVYLVGK